MVHVETTIPKGLSRQQAVPMGATPTPLPQELQEKHEEYDVAQPLAQNDEVHEEQQVRPLWFLGLWRGQGLCSSWRQRL